ncbi:MAG: GGDEF domain-containing protein [Gemmatimonadaceae bacterium]|nr:GGDEF domain-containing protein [Gemmatimonadaceae bacterium]
MAQSPMRITTGLVVTLLQVLVVLATGRGEGAGAIVAIGLAYAGFVAALGAYLHGRRHASPNLVTLALMGDLAFIFAITAAGSPPAHYARALFGTLIVVHVANFFFGRRQSWRLLPMGMLAYAALVAFAASRGSGVDVIDELWTLLISGGGTVIVLTHASDVRRRLKILVTLFERAEHGDFSQEYDESGDVRFDAVTRVGHSYNRVRQQLADMVLTDPLTGCLNRRGFDQALAREFSRATRAGDEIALMALDLDHFKRINDSWGHLAGDSVLRETGRLLRQAVRGGDVVARVGGEEFAILLADTSASGAALFATRVCDLFRVHRFTCDNHVGGLPVRVSVGVVAGAPTGEKSDAGELWARADAAMYAAKRTGRDRVRVWTPELEDEILPALTHEYELPRKRPTVLRAPD